MAGLGLIAGMLVLLGGTIFLRSGQENPPFATDMGGPEESWPLSAAGPQNDDGSVATPVLSADTDPGAGGNQLTIGRNQTFYEALQAAGAPHEDIMALVEACQRYRDLRRVKHGDTFVMFQAPDGGLEKLSFDLDEESYLTFEREGDSYQVRELTYPVRRRICGISGTITSSLYESLQQIGAPLSLAPKMNDILGWEIDFHRDIRAEDTYRILYEEVWRDSTFVRTGPILALEICNRGRHHRAFRFTAPGGGPGYYDEEGGNLQKQLMRAPLEYSRISSGFSWRRLHPVLKRYMPHQGVDYAAPVGTPVRAAGDGTVTEASRRQGNGRYLKIRHTNRAYESMYLHLSRYAKGIREGSVVKQGQVIGYVGASGYATGPHLDYRVKKNGTFVDPRSLKLPAAEPVAEEARDSFADLCQIYTRSLAELQAESPPVEIALVHTTAPPLWQPLATASICLPAAGSAVP